MALQHLQDCPLVAATGHWRGEGAVRLIRHHRTAS
jgi:hypothetical protein